MQTIHQSAIRDASEEESGIAEVFFLVGCKGWNGRIETKGQRIRFGN